MKQDEFYTPGGHVARYNAANSTGLYREAINLLETKIYEEFGYNVRMGAEFEYLVECNSDLPHEMQYNPLGLKNALDVKHLSYVPSEEQELSCNRDPLFPKSPYVTYSYRELKHTHPYYLCESVISHEANYGPMDPAQNNGTLTRMSRLGDVISSLRNTVLNGDGGSKRDFRRHYVDKVSCKAYDTASNTKSDLHLNVSLVDAKDGWILNHSFYNTIVPFLARASADGMKLIGTDENHHERYKKKGGDHYNLDEELCVADPRDNKRFTESWIENRLPAADSDPHLSILVTLVGIYRGLEWRRDGEGIIPYEERLAVNKKLTALTNEAEERFNAEDNVVRATLNMIDPTQHLGDRIFDHVREHGVTITNSAKCGPGNQPNLA